MTARALGTAALISVATSACILLVSSQEAGGTRCRFAGIETSCGRCMAEACAIPTGACCFENMCGGVIVDVEACAQGTTEACARVADSADRAGAHAELASCVATNCADTCGLFSKEFVTRCTKAYVSSKDACRCEVSSRPNSTTCSELGHSDLRCCASEGWPGPAQRCDCLSISCFSVATGCLCQRSAFNDGKYPVECSGEVCCVSSGGNCSCGNVPCHGNEKRVPSCTIAELGCDVMQRRVLACEVRRGEGGAPKASGD
jgi:hypothetical protein